MEVASFYKTEADFHRHKADVGQAVLVEEAATEPQNDRNCLLAIWQSLTVQGRCFFCFRCSAVDVLFVNAPPASI